MRIKRYKKFINENKFIDDESIKSTIKDIFIELEDIDINCDVSIDDPDMDDYILLTVHFSSVNEKPFDSNIFNDSIPMFKDYLKDITNNDDFYIINYFGYSKKYGLFNQKDLPTENDLIWLTIELIDKNNRKR